MKHDRDPFAESDEYTHSGSTNSGIAAAELDGLGAERVACSPFGEPDRGPFAWFPRTDLAQYGISRRVEHLPGRDPDAEPYGGDDVLAGSDAATRIRDRAHDRTRSNRAGVRRLARESLLRRLTRGYRSTASRGPAGAVAARRRARRDIEAAALIRAGI